MQLPFQNNTLTVTKLDSARSQLDTAISLWFQDGDPVSVHTLVAAGHHVCHDIAKAMGAKSPFFFNMDFIPPEHRAEYKRLVCEAENFFKHAERNPDPNAQITFSRDVTETYLLDAIELFLKLNGEVSDLMQAFRFRFCLTHPDLAPIEAGPMLDEPLSIQLRALEKGEFLKVYLPLLAQFGSK